VQLPQLRRVRWAVRATLFLGVAASVAANVLHALPNPISQTISAWPPLALLLTVELTSRIPMHKPLLALARVGATIAIAGIAAWVSYWHMQDVAMRWGETRTSSYLLPISVDGLIVVASVSLVELAGRLRMLEEAAARQQAPAVAPVSPVQFVQPAPAPIHAPVPPAPAFQPVPVSEAVASAPILAHSPALAEGGSVAQARPVIMSEPVHMGPRVPTSPLSGKPLSPNAPVSPAVPAQPKPAIARPVAAASGRTMVTKPVDSNSPRPRRPAEETAKLADAIEAMHPNISEAELAEQVGVSPNRLRTIRRTSTARS
jgi:hypothetical protein